MQTIGLIGGLSWHSTATYYRRLNELVALDRGGHASARITLQSLDFAEVRACQVSGDWERSAALLVDAARRCEGGGADLIAVCSNLMHKNFPAVESAVGVRAVHIADAVARVAAERGWSTLGLLGSRGVMEEDFYAERLALHGIGVLVPDESGRAMVDRVVFDELTQGILDDRSRTAYVEQMRALAERGAEAVVLACTEIGLLVGETDVPLPLIDSMEAHVRLLAELALADAAPDSVIRMGRPGHRTG
jgi:aspartate racemase